MLLTFKLDDETKINVICDRNDKGSARGSAIKYSQEIFRQKKFIIHQNSEMVDLEKWKKTTIVKCIPGGKVFSVAMIVNNQVIMNQVSASGIKSAYNNFKYMYGIDNEEIAFIYDVEQVPKKKSALVVSKNVMKDKTQTNRLLNQAVDSLSRIEGVGKYAEDLQLLCHMISDYQKGIYKQVPMNVIIKSLVILLYFISPVNLSFEAVPVIGQCDDVVLIAWFMGAVHDDLMTYKKWKTEKK